MREEVICGGGKEGESVPTILVGCATFSNAHRIKGEKPTMSSEEEAKPEAAAAVPPAAQAEETKPEAAAEAGAEDADKVADALEKVGVSGESKQK